MAVPASLQADLDAAKSLGHSLLALVKAAILLAIVAVLLSSGSQLPAIVTAFFNLVAWLVAQVVQPVTGGFAVSLTNQLAPAGGYNATGQGSNTTATPSLGTGLATPAAPAVDSGNWDTGGFSGSPTGSTTIPDTIPTVTVTPSTSGGLL